MKTNWLDHLNEEDITFLKKFVLSSGSLKELAKTYDVTYPTIRLRLDRLIQKIQVVESYEESSFFERSLRAVFADGKLETETFKTLLEAYKKEMGEE